MRKKILTIFAALLLIAAPLTLHTDAQTETSPDAPEVLSDAPAEKNESPSDTTPRGEPSYSAFGALYEKVCAHATEIFSALSFLGACLVAFGYKRGMLPLMKGGIHAASDAIRQIQSGADTALKKSGEICEKVKNDLQYFAERTKILEEALAKMEQTLCRVESTEDERAGMRLLMEGQVDLLGEIFLSSSLPQYEKERIGERIRLMKAQIGGETGES